jgi:proton-dependent oligopeptide transporter, POT family
MSWGLLPAGMTTATATGERQLFGHPTGLFVLFFAEMWERFSYYGMRALLVFYMTKGFLGYGDKQAYATYGAYTALVYMTPYFGGMLADRVLGQRRAVILGGLLMAAGHLMMTVETSSAFFLALGLLIAGNGFFKPNISTIVGSLYPKGSAKKDGGFTLFYMGINLGAAMSPILCGYVGETYGWHYGFGLATAGMLVGVAVFAAPSAVTRVLILGGAVVTAVAMPFLQDSFLQLSVRLVLAAALVAAGIAAFVAIGRGGIPEAAGAPPTPDAPRKKLGGVVRADVAIYLGSLLAVGVFTFLVQKSNIAVIALSVTGVVALVYILWEAIARCDLIERHRLFVALILTFFSLLFFAFFEQAGSSVNNFTDRNVDRVFQEKTVTQAEVGSTVRFRVPIQSSDPAVAALPLLSQEQLGQKNGDKLFTLTTLGDLRSAASKSDAPASAKTYDWTVGPENVGMGVGTSEIPASEFQAANPVFILIFGLVFSALWGWLDSRKLEPSTTVKFALGLLQLGLGFGAMWYGATQADGRGMVAMSWLLLGYLLHTTGELCLSPVGLSMITKLSPARMVSTMMGAWFLAASFSNAVAGAIAQLTGVSGEEGAEQVIPAPIETVHVYGGVFGKIAITAIVCALICFALSRLLTKWMHADVQASEDQNAGGAPRPASGELPEAARAG